MDYWKDVPGLVQEAIKIPNSKKWLSELQSFFDSIKTDEKTNKEVVKEKTKTFDIFAKLFDQINKVAKMSL